MERVSLNIEGMSCDHCVRAVDRALKGIPGVQVERVEVGSATVAYEPESVQPGRIEEAIADEGYEVTGIRSAA